MVAIDNIWSLSDNSLSGISKSGKELRSFSSNTVRGFENTQNVSQIYKDGDHKPLSLRKQEARSLLRFNFFMSDDEMHEKFNKVKVGKIFNDYALVGIHSDGDSFGNAHIGAHGTSEGWVKYSPRELADCIKEHKKYQGEPILLYACESGKYENGAAQTLSNLLGVSVVAPDAYVYLDFEGNYCVADNDALARSIMEGKTCEKNHWILFDPLRLRPPTT